MGHCTIRLTNGKIENRKSKSPYSDNDWLAVVWITDQQSIPFKYQVLDRAQSYVLNDGTLLADITSSIECDDSAVVAAAVIVVNLASGDPNEQVEAASKFVQDATITISKAYLTLGAEALGMASDLITDLPALGIAIAKAGQLVIDALVGKLADLVHGLFDDAITPILEDLVSAVRSLVGADHPNCNGEVLRDVFVFQPFTNRDDTITKTYTGPQTNSKCGNPPHTTITWQVHRDVLRGRQSEWRYCQKCHGLFYNGYDHKGHCPGGGGHEMQPSSYNIQLPHDFPESASVQANWRYCRKCYCLFWAGRTLIDQCAGGGNHEAAGYVFTLTHDTPVDPGNQNNWRFCNFCNTMFYDGYPDKGLCLSNMQRRPSEKKGQAGGPAHPGPHNASGYNFVLPFTTP